MDSPQDTIAAIATPLGEGGLGVVRVSGRQAVPIVQSLFKSHSGADLSTVPTQTCHYGLIHQALPIDEVIVSIFRAPRSYTGEDVVEISCHGSPFILQKVLSLCLDGGARLAGPGEFTLRAFLAGKMDLTQAEAVAELIHSRTAKTHAAATAQMEGRLSWEVQGLRSELVALLAHVEVELDHSDDEHPALPRDILTERCDGLRRRIDDLVASARVGQILREGFRVAIVGRPNVGKSSLLNALLRSDRAIVTPIPGTTRDTIEERVDWEGIPVVLTDTAGLRDQTEDPVEKLGIDRSRQVAGQSDLILVVLDGSEPATKEDETLLRWVQGKPHLVLLNKTDLPARNALKISECISVSAKTGAGLEALIQGVKTRALEESASSGEILWLLNARHLEALRRATQALESAVSAAGRDAFEECVALELKTALSALGEIVGETATEELLGQIFSTFCVGK